MPGAVSGRSQVPKPCKTRQRAGSQSRLLTYLRDRQASCVGPGRKVSCEGTPLARVKKDCSQPSLLRPESAMSSQLSAHAITAHTAITRISVSRCSTLPAHRGSARAEKCSTSFSADIAIPPSSLKGEPAQPLSPSEPARPFHALPLG